MPTYLGWYPPQKRFEYYYNVFKLFSLPINKSQALKLSTIVCRQNMRVE